jgi:hypothetical protein
MSPHAQKDALTTILRVMNQPTTVKPSGNRIGTILLRLVVPLWILLGASVKLWERNPQLLPKPVTDVTDFIFVRGLGLNREDYLGPAMRFMIAFEIMAALVMVVGPVQAARSLAISLMTMFCVILGLLIASGAASCGCFGASGPSPEWMLAIDLTLLIGLCVLRPRGRRLPPAELGRKVGYVMFVPVLLGVGIGFGVPDRAAVTLEVVDTATPVVTTPEVATPEVTATIAWPPMPATAKPWYAPEFESWKDQRLDAQELMLLVQRPLPANLNVGRHHIVFMRDDCDHCHELLNSYFSGPLTTPTTSISIPDATGELLENPCSECGKATLPKGINYVLSTPVLLTVEDGVVVGVCMNSEDATLVRAALNAKGKVTP